MADNINITAGTGTSIATDQVGSDHYQKVKLVDGTADSSTAIAVDVGVKANALRTAPANNITDGTYIGDIKFGEALPTGSNAIGKLAANTGIDIGDVDVTSIAAGDNNIGNVDIVTVPAPLNVVGGGAEATALRVTVANDSTGVITVDGTVTANLSATDNGVLDNIDSNTDYGAVVGGGAEATALRVTIANDSTGVVTVDDGGGTLTVDGTVTANLSATDNTVLDNIDSDTNDIKNAVEIMDDWDATHASAAPADGVCVMGAGYSAGLPTDIGADADAARICTDRYGRILRGIMPQNFQATISSADAQSATQVKAKTADRKMYILSLIASTDTALNLQFQDDTGPTVLIENIHLAANGGFVMNFPPEAPLVVNTNEDFDVIASAAGNISVTITGYLAP